MQKIALLLIPAAVYLCFFVVFEPNNYFGLKKTSAGTAPIGRIQAFLQDPGDRIILGDSRLAHFDMELADKCAGAEWQNLSFGGASLRETLDLLDFCRQKNPEISDVVIGLSFYTLNSRYDTDRMSTLQDTLRNPLAYIFNLEYNVNTLTAFENWLIWRGQASRGETDLTWAEAQQERETADWSDADYLLADGSRSPWHSKLVEYAETIRPVITSWSLNREMFDRLLSALQSCSEAGIRVTVVLPPMHESVTELCRELAIDSAMEEPLAELNREADSLAGVTVLDYEWGPLGKDLGLEEWQYFDGFHLDTEKGLPIWTEDLFTRLGQ